MLDLTEASTEFVLTFVVEVEYCIGQIEVMNLRRELEVDGLVVLEEHYLERQGLALDLLLLLFGFLLLSRFILSRLHCFLNLHLGLGHLRLLWGRLCLGLCFLETLGNWFGLLFILHLFTLHLFLLLRGF